MATATGFTAARMLQIENETVVDGEVDGNGHLILSTREGEQIDAGPVVGAVGPRGYNGLYDTWTYQSGLVYPGPAKLSFGAATPLTATQINFHMTPQSGNSFEGLFKVLRVGSMITVQNATAPNEWIQYAVKSPFVFDSPTASVQVEVAAQGSAASSLTSMEVVNVLFTQPTTVTALNLPAGLVFANTLPTGYPEGTIPLNGQAISRTTYALLFEKWGTYYGAGDGSTTFNVPDYRGRGIMGKDPSQTEFDVMGETGGEKKHTQTVAEMPSHDHDWNGQTMSWGTGNISFTSQPQAQASAPSGSGLGTFQDQDGWADSFNRGGGAAFNVLDPYVVAEWVVTTGIGGGLYPTSTGQMGKGTAAQRDGFYGVPTTDPQRVALANSMPVWFNTEKGWEESYYAVTGLSGLTVRGLRAGVASGWYPTGQSVYALARRTTGQAITANTSADVIMDTVVVRRGITMALPTTDMVLPFAGIYEFSLRASAVQVGANYMNLSLIVDGTDIKGETSLVFPHTNAYSTAAIEWIAAVLTAAPVVRMRAFLSSAGSVVEFTPQLSVKYLGPALVDG